MDILRLAIHNRMMNGCIDRIIGLLRRFGKADLAEHDIPICVMFGDMTGMTRITDIDDYAELFLLDRAEYIDERSFALHVTGLTDVPDSSAAKMNNADQSTRKPGTERRFVVRKDANLEPPFISHFYLYPIIRLLERAVQLLDGERMALEMQPFLVEESDRMNLLADMIDDFLVPKAKEELAGKIRARSRQNSEHNGNVPRKQKPQS